jgi:hypothetical protein
VAAQVHLERARRRRVADDDDAAAVRATSPTNCPAVSAKGVVHSRSPSRASFTSCSATGAAHACSVNVGRDVSARERRGAAVGRATLRPVALATASAPSAATTTVQASAERSFTSATHRARMGPPPFVTVGRH